MMLLTKQWTPPHGYCYPVTAGRKYIALWESEYAWLRYSAWMLLFVHTVWGKSGTSIHLTTFQKTGFRDWKNAKGTKRGALPIHESTDAHKNSSNEGIII